MELAKRAVLVDSDIIISALRIGLTDGALDDSNNQRDSFAVSAIAVAEVREGAYLSADTANELRRMDELFAGFVILDVTSEVADAFSQLRAFLRQQGNLIPDMDLLIAATAVHYGLPLLTNNRRHFARIPGLVLVDGDL